MAMQPLVENPSRPERTAAQLAMLSWFGCQVLGPALVLWFGPKTLFVRRYAVLALVLQLVYMLASILLLAVVPVSDAIVAMVLAVEVIVIVYGTVVSVISMVKAAQGNLWIHPVARLRRQS